MRIALVIVSRGYGGLERHLVDLANELAKNHEVTVFGDPSFRAKLDAKVALVTLHANTWRHNPFSLRRLRIGLNRFAPDVIHAQANKAAAMVQSSGIKAPVMVATVHNIKNDTRPFRQYDGVIAVSRAAQAKIENPNCVVIENGISPVAPISEATKRDQRRIWLEQEEPLTIAIGRLVFAKGFDLLLEAWRDLPGKLVIVGSGPDESALKAQRKKLGLEQRVVFAGYRSDVPALMQSADLLVMPSRREGFPYVLVEALHAGIPIVATDIPGARDFLPAIAVVPREDVEAIHTALAQALSNWQDLKRLYAPYCDRARKELTLQNMAEKTVAFYESTRARLNN